MQKSKNKEKKYYIITGLSGSGKTILSVYFEDSGFYRVDNIPTELIPKFMELYDKQESPPPAVLVVDIRGKDFINNFPKIYKKLTDKRNDIELLFLEARDEVLLKRFKEARRPHPFFSSLPLSECIKKERELLAPIRALADEIIDTSNLSASELREYTRSKLLMEEKGISISIISFGYKWGIPSDSDLVFDLRFLPNPFYKDELKELSGKDKKVRDYVLSFDETKEYIKKLEDFLEYLIPKYIKEGKRHLTISFGCTGGRHRSVIIAGILRNFLHNFGYKTYIYHRDIRRE
ncbi:MAG: RNase adapter RapZ [Candidatus Aminicenantia bacterium]